MRKAPANVHELIEPAIKALGYELLGVEYLAQGKHSLLRVYIDNDEGINVDDCARVSHQVSGLLDVEDVIRGYYNLEVSSPGLDRPLFTLAQFERFIGETAKVHLSMPLAGRRNFTGTILKTNSKAGAGSENPDGAAGGLILEVDGEEVELLLSQIDKANLVPHI